MASTVARKTRILSSRLSCGAFQIFESLCYNMSIKFYTSQKILYPPPKKKNKFLATPLVEFLSVSPREPVDEDTKRLLQHGAVAVFQRQGDLEQFGLAPELDVNDESAKCCPLCSQEKINFCPSLLRKIVCHLVHLRTHSAV